MQRRLAKIMDKRNLSNAELARRAGISTGPIATLLAGGRGVRLESLDAIAAALGVRVGWLLDGGWWERLWRRPAIDTAAHKPLPQEATDGQAE